jgi:cystathionine beta-synthase
MRAADVSLLPVMDQDRVAGLLDEADLLTHVQQDPARFKDSAAAAMTAAVETLAPSAPLSRLREVLDRGLTAVISDGGHFHGLITRIDLINHLRRSYREQ